MYYPEIPQNCAPRNCPDALALSGSPPDGVGFAIQILLGKDRFLRLVQPSVEQRP
jgi:hypothetical protein